MADNLLSYRYTGINNQGKRTTGSIKAASPNEAQSELKKSGIEVISLEARKELNIPFLSGSSHKKIKQKDILLFTRYLSTMIAAGLPILQALDLISHDQENAAMKALIINIRESISGGNTIADSFSQHPMHFSNLYTSLVKAGEKSGTLDKILSRLALYLERSETLKRKIKKALIYPIAILCVALGVSLILLLFVVPQFQQMFASFGAQLPMFTRWVVDFSNFLQSYWWLLLIIVVGGIWGLRYHIKHSESAQLFIDKWILKVYIIGPVLRKGIIARFTRTLATTLASGMPIVESMKSMAPVMGNRIYTKAVLDICNDVVNGHQLSVAMRDTNLFPNMALQMISVGEASGSLSDMLHKVADYYEEEVNSIVDNLSSLLEPIIMVILGVVVGGFIVAMYLPIFRMGSLF